MRTFFKYFFIVFILAVGLFIWKNTILPKTTGLLDQKLHPCPKSPNCVNDSSFDEMHAIKPLAYTSEDILEQIKSYLSEHYDTYVVCSSGVYLHIVVTSEMFKFKDDLEFLVDKQREIIHIRSASRVGYSDMGVNRERIEKLREFLQEK